MSENELPKSYWMTKAIIRLVVLIGIIIIGIAVGDITAQYIAFIGIEWVQVSSIGTLIIGVWVLLASAVADRLLDRLFRALAKNSCSHPKA